MSLVIILRLKDKENGLVMPRLIAPRVRPEGGGDNYPAAGGWSIVSGICPVWTPDQRFFITTRPDDPEGSSNHLRHFVRVNIDTGEIQDLGLSGESIMYWRLSPDGRKLAYVAGSESYEVWVMENFLPGGQEG